MSMVNQIFLIIVFFCLAERYKVHTTIKSYHDYQNYPEKQVFYDDYSFKDGNLVYAVCDVYAKEKICTLMQKQYPDGKLLRSCNISLQAYYRNTNLTEKIHVVAFGRDHAILFWDEIGPESFFFQRIVKLDNCAYTGFTRLDTSKEIYHQLRLDGKIVTYDDTFEMFIKSNEDNGTEIVTTVSSRGLNDKGPTDFLKSGKYSVRHISPIGINSPNNKSYIYSKEWLEEYQLAILKPDGSEKVLATKDNKFTFYTSLVNDLITLCEREGLHSIMTCTQYDKEGDIKFNITFDDDNFKEKSAPREIYNLPGGGFLIALSEYAKSGDEIDYSTITYYVVIKVNGEGKKVGTVHLKDLVDADNTIKAYVDVRIWKNEDYCAAVIGQGVNQKNVNDKLRDLSVNVNCFTDADLTA